MTEAAGSALRLLCITGSLAHGGAERHAVTLVNGLAALGHECHLAYVKDASAQLERLRPGRRGTVQCLGATRYLDRRAVSDLAMLMKRLNPSVVLAQNPYALLYAWLARASARARAPIVTAFHSNRLLGVKERLQMAAYRPLYWSAACTVYVCEAQQRRWRRQGVFSRRNEVIYNGVDLEAFAPGAAAGRPHELRRSLGFDADAYVIGITAALRPEKNHLLLVDAVAELRAGGNPACALLIGDGEMRPAIEARARELGIAAAVAITGFRQDVRPYVHACDTMVLCSDTEALPLAALEALALGKPVVHSAVGGAAEIIMPGVNGELFPPGDRQALVLHLAALVDPALRARMGANARRVAEERFSERAMIRRYETLLLGIADRRERRVQPVDGATARAPAVLLLGPGLNALSGVSAHLRALLGSSLAESFELVHFRVGGEDRRESAAARIARLATSPFALAAAIRRTRARVVHVNTSLNAGAFWRDLAYVLAARFCGARVVYQVHGGALPQQFFAGIRILDSVLRAALGLADQIVVLARSELAAYRRFLPGRPVLLAPNAIPCAPLPTPRTPATSLALRLVYIGRLVREKGVQDLLQALAAMKRDASPPQLVIAGGGPEEPRLRRLAAELGLDGAVTFAGPVTGADKTRLLRESDLFVLPSYAEGLPYAVLESMAAGTAVVVTPVGAIPDLVTEGIHGAYIPARDPAAIARVLGSLAADRERLARMGCAANARVRETCSIDRLAGRLAEVYGGLSDPRAGWPSPAG
ncbi:MAG: glycosyltransferase [Steroidobacteraceae bacterium]